MTRTVARGFLELADDAVLEVGAGFIGNLDGRGWVSAKFCMWAAMPSARGREDFGVVVVGVSRQKDFGAKLGGAGITSRRGRLILRQVDVERRTGEVDVGDAEAGDVGVHEAGGLVGVAAVEGDALDEGGGAVADPHHCYTDVAHEYGTPREFAALWHMGDRSHKPAVPFETGNIAKKVASARGVGNLPQSL